MIGRSKNWLRLPTPRRILFDYGFLAGRAVLTFALCIVLGFLAVKTAYTRHVLVVNMGAPETGISLVKGKDNREWQAHHFEPSSSRSLRMRASDSVDELWVWLHLLICIVRTAAVLLGLLQQVDLLLEQLIFELHVLEFQIQPLLQLRLTNTALIEAALN